MIKSFSNAEASGTVLGVISLLAASIFVFHLAAYWPLFTAFLVCSCLAVRCGFPARRVADMAWAGVKKATIPILMLTLVGMLMALWRLNGTAATVAVYGSSLVRPGHFVVAAFLACAAVSMVVGTASGTVNIIGLPLMIVGQAYHIPQAAVAGAIISGAYLGDRSSLVSSTLHMVSRLTGNDPRTVFRRLFSTLVPAVVVSTLLYWWIQPLPSAASPGSSSANHLLEALKGVYDFSPALLFAPALVAAMAVLRVSILTNLGVNVLIAAMAAVSTSQAPLLSVLRTAILGHHPALDPAEGVVSAVTSGGGVVSMVGVLLVLISSTALSGVLVGTGLIDAVLKRWLSGLRSSGQALLATMALSILTGMIAANQALSVVLPCMVFERVYRERELPEIVLAHVVSDSGVIAAPLIPWSAAALGPAAILGVLPTRYIPYAFLCWVLPAVTVSWVAVCHRRLKTGSRHVSGEHVARST